MERRPRDPKFDGVHWSHCDQGENYNSCKYGDWDCPAMEARKKKEEERALANEERFEELWESLASKLQKDLDIALFLDWAVGRARFDIYNASEDPEYNEALLILGDINHK